MRVYKLYVQQASTAANAVNTTILRNGRIKQIVWNVAIDQAADNSTALIELSLSATNNNQNNAPVGPLSSAFMFGNGTVASTSGINYSHPCDCPVGAGEILYLNFTLTATTAYTACYVWVDE